MNLQPICAGTLTSQADGSVTCSEAWQFVELAPLFDPSMLDPAELGMAMGLGFMISLVPMGAAWGVRQLLKLLEYS